MKKMLDRLKSYLQNQGFENIFLDFMPAVEKSVNAVDLAEWNNVVNSGDNSSQHYIQVQVRRESYDLAKSDCQRILELLDSGIDETPIQLTENTFCISRIRRREVILSRGEGYTTFYGEIAVWGNK